MDTYPKFCIVHKLIWISICPAKYLKDKTATYVVAAKASVEHLFVLKIRMILQQFIVVYKYLHDHEYAMLWSEQKTFEIRIVRAKKERIKYSI